MRDGAEGLVLWLMVAIVAVVGGSPVAASAHPIRPASDIVWSDEFNAPAGTAPDPRKWKVETWAPGEESQEYIDSRDTSAHDGSGHMVLTAIRRTSPGGRAYVSGRLSNQFGDAPFYKTYGRWEARLLLPSGQGIWPAFWMLGDYRASLPAGWPACGELDVMETINGAPEAHMTIHTVNAAGSHFMLGPQPARAPSGTWAGAWHVFAMDWRSGVITWLLDGVVTGRLTRAQVEAGGGIWLFDGAKPQSPILNLAVGSPWTGPPSGWDSQRMLIDYVRIRR
jgi:hypothetical protein